MSSALAERPTTLLDMPMQAALQVEHLYDFEIYLTPCRSCVRPAARV